MQVFVPTTNQLLADKYGKYADSADKLDGHPIVSFPFSIQDVPSQAQSLALTLIDHDSIPVCGFTWIHWTAANIDPRNTEFPEDASRQMPFAMIQGNNSNAGSMVGATNPNVIRKYTGPTPPDKDHAYTLTVYALDTHLDLQDGYWLNAFYHAAEGHILDQASTDIISRS